VPAVLITHGLGEHSSRYWHVAEQLAANGCEVASYDLRGHGRSGGRRGDAPGFRAFLDDLELVLSTFKECRSTPGPLFLYGHSLGGLIVLRFLQQRRHSAGSVASVVDGVIAASPWLRLAFDPPRWKRFLAGIARWVCPGFRQITGLDPARLSRDLEFLAAMPDADLIHHQLSARLYYEVRQACSAVLAGAAEIALPLLLLHGQADPITSWAATRDFFEANASPDKTLKLYPGVFHETHNDLGREEVLDDIVAWLRRHG